jgi:hypothetical protein
MLLLRIIPLSTPIIRVVAQYADIATLRRRVAEQQLIVAINGGLLDKYRRELAQLVEKRKRGPVWFGRRPDLRETPPSQGVP